MANASDASDGRPFMTQYRGVLLLLLLVISGIFNGIVIFKDAGGALKDQLLSRNSSRPTSSFWRPTAASLPTIPSASCEAPHNFTCRSIRKTDWDDLLSVIDPNPPRWIDRPGYERTASWASNLFPRDTDEPLRPASIEPLPRRVDPSKPTVCYFGKQTGEGFSSLLSGLHVTEWFRRIGNVEAEIWRSHHGYDMVKAMNLGYCKLRQAEGCDISGDVYKQYGRIVKSVCENKVLPLEEITNKTCARYIIRHHQHFTTSTDCYGVLVRRAGIQVAKRVAPTNTFLIHERGGDVYGFLRTHQPGTLEYAATLRKVVGRNETLSVIQKAMSCFPETRSRPSVQLFAISEFYARVVTPSVRFEALGAGSAVKMMKNVTGAYYRLSGNGGGSRLLKTVANTQHDILPASRCIGKDGKPSKEGTCIFDFLKADCGRIRRGL